MPAAVNHDGWSDHGLPHCEQRAESVENTGARRKDPTFLDLAGLAFVETHPGWSQIWCSSRSPLLPQNLQIILYSEQHSGSCTARVAITQMGALPGRHGALPCLAWQATPELLGQLPGDTSVVVVVWVCGSSVTCDATCLAGFVLVAQMCSH